MKVIEETENGQFLFYCPGCKCMHYFQIAPKKPAWIWDGNFERPTVNPSIRVSYFDEGGGKVTRTCHLYLRSGRIDYLGDSWHELKGKTIDMVAI